MNTPIDFVFKTYFICIWTIFFGLVYLVVLLLQKRAKEINMLDFTSVAISSSSVIGGFKLMYVTFVNAYNSQVYLETDKLYTVYGGCLIIWLSIRTIYSKIKKQ